MDSESELMAQFNAPRDLVREALASLSEEGRLTRRRGLGTLAIGGPDKLEIEAPESGRVFAGWTSPTSPSVAILLWEWLAAPASVAERLSGVQAGDDCLCVDYVFLVDGRAMAVATNYLRAAEARSVNRTSFRGDYHALIRDSGVEISDHHLEMHAGNADPFERSVLGLGPGRGVLRFEQHMLDRSRDVVNVAFGAAGPDCRFRFGSSILTGASHA